MLKDLAAKVLLLVVGTLSMFGVTDDCETLSSNFFILLGLADTLVPFLSRGIEDNGTDLIVSHLLYREPV